MDSTNIWFGLFYTPPSRGGHFVGVCRVQLHDFLVFLSVGCFGLPHRRERRDGGFPTRMDDCSSLLPCRIKQTHRHSFAFCSLDARLSVEAALKYPAREGENTSLYSDYNLSVDRYEGSTVGRCHDRWR